MALINFKPMIPDLSPRRDDDQAKEKMFLECYSWLVECAVNITHEQRERAEDLVHDAFVQFLDQNVDIASISDIRGYLNGMLRNLHLLQLRRSTRHPVQSLTLLDHDSALVGLRTRNSAEQLQSADLLFRACEFACYRKEATPASSILILRFFHGFYPGEIAVLLKITRNAAHKWIKRGRNETKQYLASPYPLPDSRRKDHGKTIPGSAGAFLRRLRERIFDSCTSDCSVLTGRSGELGVQELAHLVSCRTCLERRSRETRLRHVAGRMADDISDRDDGRPESGTGGSGQILSLRPRRKPSKRAILRDVYARRKELFEHRPKELSLASDGALRATLLVDAVTNTLNVSLDGKEVPNSIAVLSEQEFNFLLLNQHDLMCSERRVHRLALSDDRSLEVTVTPEALGPVIQIVYLDPSFVVEDAETEEDEPRSIPARNQLVEFPSSPSRAITSCGPERTGSFLHKLRNWIPAMNPLLTSAIILGVAAAMCLLLWLRSTPAPSVGEILDHAQETDRGAATAANHPGVIYEKVAIRTPHRTLERTIYRDVQGIRHPRRQKLSPEDEQLKGKLASAGVNWDAPLSAVDFAEWRRRSNPTRDSVTRSGQHLLMLATTPLADNVVVRETLTVRDTDFQGVDRTVELRDTGTVEIAQLNYDVLPWGAVNQVWFEPVPAGAATDAPGGLSPSPSRLPSEPELETELAVRYALHGIDADLGEPIEIHPRGPARASVSVVGVLPSLERKKEVLAALSVIPGVATRLRTEEEAAPQRLPERVRRAEPLIVTAHSPIEKELLNYFGDPSAVENFSKRSIAVTGDLMAHAWALRHLSERFGSPSTGLELGLSPASSQLLQSMRSDHYRAMSEATAELATSLRPVLVSIVEVDPEPSTSLPLIGLPLFDRAQQVQHLTMELAFGSGSPNGSQVTEPVKAAQELLDALRGLEIKLEEQP